MKASGDLTTAADRVVGMEGVVDAAATAEGLELIVDDAGDLLTAVLSAVGEAGVSVSSVDIDEPDLETVFLHMTGRALRD